MMESNWEAGAVLATAHDLVRGDRQTTHGDKVENHENIALLWSAYLEVPITAHQVAIMMCLLKIGRTKLGDLNRDDYVDGAGYMAIAAEIMRRTGSEA